MDDTYSLPSCKEDYVVGQVILQIIQMIHMDKFGEKMFNFPVESMF